MTPVVVTVNVALDFPAVIVTEAGAVAAALLLERPTVTLLGPAGPLRVTVPVEGLPPTTDDGLKLTVARTAGVTVRVAVWLIPGIAVICACVCVLTGIVFTANETLVWPAGTVMETGTVASASYAFPEKYALLDQPLYDELIENWAAKTGRESRPNHAP